MDVQLKSLGCVGQIGAVLSLGFLPLMLRSQNRQYPATLEPGAMVLRNGARIPWEAFTRFEGRPVLLNGSYQHTLYELWHPGGRIHFSSHRIQDAEAVVQYIADHLRPDVARPAG